MAAPDPAVIDQLPEVVRPGRVAVDRGELEAHARDCWPALTMRERAGERLPTPAAVCWPVDAAGVARLHRWATDNRVPLVPFGGGGGVVGGAAPVDGCVVLDTKAMRRIGPLDPDSGVVACEPGVVGQRLEEWLGARGMTLGHFPSSVTLSTVGGFAAARSAGQASTRYGTFARMVCGLEAVLPDGTEVRLRPRPESAAGPDLAGLLLGSEGVLGTITRVHLRCWPKPELTVHRGFAMPDFAAGLAAIRRVLRRGLRPAVVRLHDAAESAFGHGMDDGSCLLATACEGHPPLARLEAAELAEAAADHGGRDLGAEPGEHWHAHRHDVSYRLADFIKPGGEFGDAVAVDTIEVAAGWGDVAGLHQRVGGALGEHMDLVMCHASHAYPDGACLYFTFGAAGQGDEQAVQARYRQAWQAAMRATVDGGGTITHHHGVGLARAGWLATELGEGGWRLLAAVKQALDPAGVANPGKLGLPDPAAAQGRAGGEPDGGPQGEGR